MKILSLTTSSPICGVAILEDASLIKEINIDNGLTHSETLMPNIKQILEETSLSLKDIDLIACDIGPGSFTGIRIGVATVKAFADSLGLKSVGVSSLDALTLSVLNSSIIVSLIDAKNDNAYTQIVENQSIKRNPSFDNIDNFLLELQTMNYKDISFVGTGAIAYKEKILECFPDGHFVQDNNLSAKSVGIVGFNNYKLRKIFKVRTSLYKKTRTKILKNILSHLL